MATKILFGKNWNNKLHCDCFSTIRLKNDIYKVGSVYEIILGGEPVFDCTIMLIKELKLIDITEGMALLDTGTTAKEFREIFIKIYKKHPIDWKTQVLQWIVLKKI